jgi:RNA polymerase sigma-70 factor (ECF subfamily)
VAEIPRVRPLPSDEELAARLQSRDEAAFASMVDSWSGGMLRLARSFVSTDESAAEVVQEAWLAVVAGIARYERRSSLRTWVYRILVNIAKRRGALENRSVPWSSLSPTDEAGTGTVEPGRFRPPASRMQATGGSSQTSGRRRNSRRWPASFGRRWRQRSTSYPTASES